MLEMPIGISSFFLTRICDMKPSLTFRFAFFLAIATFFLIIAGGLVTSTDSGLSVPDWPLSYGTLTPPMVGGIRFEHSHRIIAGTVALLTLVLTVIIIKTESRRWLKKLGIAALGLVLVQAILGGITVLTMLPTAVSVLHAAMGQSFFVLICLIAVFASRWWESVAALVSEQAQKVKRLSLMTFGFVFLQLFLGAYVRHSGGNGVAIHIIGAVLVLVHIFLVAGRVGAIKDCRKMLSTPAMLLGLFGIVQIFLGLSAYVVVNQGENTINQTLGEVLLPTAHQATGALILALAAILAVAAQRTLREPSDRV